MVVPARSAFAASRGDRWRSGVAVVVIHLGLGYVLLNGLGVTIVPQPDTVTQMISIGVPPPPPIIPPPPPPPKKSATKASGSAPRAPTPAPPGGSPGPVKRAALPAPTAPIILDPVAAGGGSVGVGASVGAGSGGGQSGTGSGDGAGEGDGSGDGGTDIEQIAGDIRRSDYPRVAREARLGGRVLFTFIVGVDGRVSRCTVTRSSGVGELDEATCRIVTARFRYRPATDRRGRPVPTEVEGEHVWEEGRR